MSPRDGFVLLLPSSKPAHPIVAIRTNRAEAAISKQLSVNKCRSDPVKSLRSSPPNSNDSPANKLQSLCVSKAGKYAPFSNRYVFLMKVESCQHRPGAFVLLAQYHKLGRSSALWHTDNACGHYSRPSFPVGIHEAAPEFEKLIWNRQANARSSGLINLRQRPLPLRLPVSPLRPKPHQQPQKPQPQPQPQ